MSDEWKRLTQDWKALTHPGDQRRNLLVLLVVAPMFVFAILALWIGILLHSERLFGVQLSAEAVLNVIIIVILAAIFLPIAHGGAYRWQWHLQRELGTGRARIGELPDYASERTARPPRVAGSWRTRVLYAGVYMVAIPLLIASFAPIDNQSLMQQVIARFSAGRASASSLAAIIFAWGPMLGFSGVLFAVLNQENEQLRANAIAPDDALKIRARHYWLLSFAVAFGMTSFLCFVFGSMIAQYLA